MTAKPPARRKPIRQAPAGPALGVTSLLLRVSGIEARVKAEAQVAATRFARIEARLDRIAAALHRLIAARDDNPSDSENE